jgi:hypothetical protein
MDKKYILYICNGGLFSHKEEQNHVIYIKMDGTRDFHGKQNKPESKSPISHVFSHIQNLNLKRNDMNERGVGCSSSGRVSSNPSTAKTITITITV